MRRGEKGGGRCCGRGGLLRLGLRVVVGLLGILVVEERVLL